jgi:hypothetical protein
MMEEEEGGKRTRNPEEPETKENDNVDKDNL